MLLKRPKTQEVRLPRSFSSATWAVEGTYSGHVWRDKSQLEEQAH